MKLPVTLYGGVAPVAIKKAEPSQAPLQVIFSCCTDVTAKFEQFTPLLLPTVTVVLQEVHPLASVTQT